MTGTVISGTMRPEDLIPAFARELEYMLQGPTAEMAALIAEANTLMSCYARTDAWYMNAEALVEELFDALNAVAPEGQYFGPHPGDGSDYGFWELDPDA